jgi:hypothetical protein
MGKNVINPEQAAELERLFVEMTQAHERAAAAISTNGKLLEGPNLDKFMEEENKVRVIVRRIKEIQGE